MRRLSISAVGHYQGGAPNTVALPWEHFVQLLTTHQCHPDKFAVPCWSPTVFSRPERSNAAAQYVSALVLDIDDAADIPGVCDALEARGLEYIFHSTHSGAGRVVLGLTEPVPAPTWGQWYRSAVEWLGVRASNDPRCADVARQYFAPSHPPGVEPASWYQPGITLDPAIVPLSAAPAAGGSRTILPLSRNAVERLAKRWRGKLHPLSDALDSLLAGEPFAPTGARDVVTFQLCKDLAKAFPHASAEDLGGLFIASLSQMGPDAPDPLPKLRKALDDQAAADAPPVVDQASWDEIQRLTALHGPLDKRWIIQRGPVYWLLAPDGYRGPYGVGDVGSAALRDLAPAAAAGVSLYALTPQGQPRRKLPSELVDAYGSVAEHLRISYSAQHTHYDADRRTMVEAPCPRRAIVAAFHPGVAEWLNLLFGAKVEKGLGWLSLVDRLDSPCAALFMTGAPGAGKSLLAAAVAALWADNWADLESVMSGWNADAMMQCPLAVADETLPKDARGFQRTAELRRLIQERTRSVRRKFLPDAALDGCIRIMVMANNENVLALHEQLEMHDIQAITERFLHISVPDSAADFLRNAVGRTLPTSGAELRQAVTAHVAWLIENFRFAPMGRFMVTARSDDTLYRMLAVRGGLRSSVLRWIVGWIQRPDILTHVARGETLCTVRRSDRTGRVELLLHVKALEMHWALYCPNEPTPRIGALASAVSSITNGRRYKLDGVNYRMIDLENIRAWCEQTGFAEPEAVLGALTNILDRPARSVLAN